MFVSQLQVETDLRAPIIHYYGPETLGPAIMVHLIQRFAGTFQLVFVVAVIGSAIFLSSTLKPEESAGPPMRAASGVPVTVVAPLPTAYAPFVRLNGVVEARTTTNLVPQVSGRIVEVSPAFRPGSFVASGDTLFRIDPADYELAVERTFAEIEGARSDLALLEAQAAAEQKIWDKQFPDRQIPDLIARVPQIAAAQARIRAGEAARQAAQLSLSRTVVRTPFDARVLDTRLEVGQVVSTNASVGSIFSVDSLEIAVPVSSEELALIGNAEGSDATITGDRLNDVEIGGTVVRTAAMLDERTRLATLFVAPDDEAELMLGEFVNVEIMGQNTASTLRLPAASLTSRDQLWVVEDGLLAERRVDVLGIEAETAVVKSFDIADGVVAVPPANVRNGLPVTVQMPGYLASTGGSAGGAE
jgi:RND family efflux transporter MFP subunit